MEETDHRPFAERVSALRESWADVRLAADYSHQRDRETQFEALQMIYHWTVDAVAQMQSVYGPQIEMRASALTPGADSSPGFIVAIEDAAALAASLEPMKGADGRWHIAIATRTSGNLQWTPVTHDRKNAFWTRSRIEDVLLSLLAAFERSRSRPTNGVSWAPDASSALG